MGKDNAVFISEMPLHALTEVADAFQQRDLPQLIQETDTASVVFFRCAPAQTCNVTTLHLPTHHCSMNQACPRTW